MGSTENWQTATSEKIGETQPTPFAKQAKFIQKFEKTISVLNFCYMYLGHLNNIHQSYLRGLYTHFLRK